MCAVQNGNDVIIRQLEPQPVVSIRATIPVEELGKVMGDRIQALSEYLQQHRARAAGPFFVRYHTFGDTYTDMETGIPVVEPLAGDAGASAEAQDGGGIVTGVLTGGLAATTSYTGPHNGLGEAYARIEGWLRQQGREPDGPTREVYHWIDFSRDPDPSDGHNPSAQRIELIQPFR
jgi:effector-binding domain-containing protein